MNTTRARFVQVVGLLVILTLLGHVQLGPAALHARETSAIVAAPSAATTVHLPTHVVGSTRVPLAPAPATHGDARTVACPGVGSSCALTAPPVAPGGPVLRLALLAIAVLAIVATRQARDAGRRRAERSDPTTSRHLEASVVLVV